MTEIAARCLTAHLDAENRHDLEAIMATYVADPRVAINGQTFLGRERVQMFHERFGFGGNGAFSGLRVNERKRHQAESAVIIEQTLLGTHTGVWQGIQPTHQSFEIAVCTVYSFGDCGKLASEDVYFDSLVMRRMLGIAV
jgi:hypothetical protein